MKDVLLIHSEHHLSRVKSDRDQVYKTALLAVGGAILAAEYAFKEQPMFAVIRPPGHHASPEGYWGFCYFNNIAIGAKYLLNTGKAKKVAVYDFDNHFGNGTYAVFENELNVLYISSHAHTSY